MSLNKVQIIGYLGADPETRYMPSGKPVTNFRVATSETWKDKETGDKKEKTEWHSIVVFDRLAEVVAEFTLKGSHVYVEGKLQTRKWQDKEGKDRYTTEIVAQAVQFLGSRATAAAPQKQERTPEPAAADGGFDDDIPF